MRPTSVSGVFVHVPKPNQVGRNGRDADRAPAGNCHLAAGVGLGRPRALSVRNVVPSMAQRQPFSVDPGVCCRRGQFDRTTAPAKALSGLGHRTPPVPRRPTGQIQRRQDFRHGLPPFASPMTSHTTCSAKAPTPNARRPVASCSIHVFGKCSAPVKGRLPAEYPVVA